MRVKVRDVKQQLTESRLPTLFRALADPTRLRLLNLMQDGEVCVCFFVEIFGFSQPKISRHLAYLRKAGIVSSRKEGKWMHYRLVEPISSETARIIKEVLRSLKDDSLMRRDRSALAHFSCAPKLPASLRIAPRPHVFRRFRS